MTYIRTLAVAFTICAALAGLSGRASALGQLTLSGRVSLQMKGALPRFTVRLYPPSASKRPTLVTYTDAGGNFKFTALDAGRYLLELYQGNTLVYQKVIALDKNQPPQPLVITLKLKIDTSISQVIEYFEIFMSRMTISRRGANFLNCDLSLVINDVQLM